MAATDSPPSIGSAAVRRVAASPIAFHFSGRTTRSAPVAAACATRRSAVSRLAALSARLVICTQATRIRSGMGRTVTSKREVSGGNPPRGEDDRARRRLPEAGPPEQRGHALPPRAGYDVIPVRPRDCDEILG